MALTNAERQARWRDRHIIRKEGPILTHDDLLIHAERILTDRFCIPPKAWPLPESLSCIGVDVQLTNMPLPEPDELWKRFLQPLWATLAGTIRHKHHGGTMYQPHWAITLAGDILRVTLITEPNEFKVAEALVKQQEDRAA